MFGISDASVIIAIIILIGSALTSIIYGIVKWNSEGEITKEQLLEEEIWENEESLIDKELGGDL
ncbi:MAG: hypothetical protein JXR63_05395 [Spirochaetales bacterium]|nr:hypothetical protein [Spirochaetales bacterium]